jgi:hypothetical protein
VRCVAPTLGAWFAFAALSTACDDAGSDGSGSTLDPVGQGGSGTSGAPGGGASGASAIAGMAGPLSPAGSGGAAGSGVAGGAAGTIGMPEAGAMAAIAPPDLSHTFERLVVAPQAEEQGLCQSWTLGNAEPLWIHRIDAKNDGGLHHSNWIWVPDSMYPGDDGTWKCTERNFDQIIAGAFGGVLFAQSTQSVSDSQEFPDGAAFLVPANARVIGDVHTLNTTDTAIETQVHFDLYTLPESEVTIRLQPMAYTNLALDIAPMMETHARMQCQTPQADFDVYYVLPHFHVLGQRLRIDVAGGSMDGMEVYRSTAPYGEPLGQNFDPPISVKGALGLGITCDFVNPRAATVKYGFGDQEMCVVLLYSTGKKAGGQAISNYSTKDESGVHKTEGLCIAVGAP